MTQQDRNAEQQHANETQQDQNVTQQLANQDVASLLVGLTRSVDRFDGKFRRSRVERAAQWIVTGAVVAFLLYYFAFDLPDRRDASYQNTRDLVCFVVKNAKPGVSLTTDDLRSKYHCPPFNAADVPAPSGHASGSPSSSATPRAGGPSPVRTPGASTTTAPGSTTTVRAGQPPLSAAATVTRMATVTRTAAPVTRTVTITRVPPLLSLPTVICQIQLVGIPLCRTETP